MRRAVSRAEAAVPAASDRNPAVQRAANRTGLPDSLKDGIEELSGMDMSAVRVRYNSRKPEQVRAHAYTQGHQIEVAPGQERHLPHEAWHVVQQMQGRVRPTMHEGGVAINDSDQLEREADTMGRKAMQLRRVSRSAPAGAVALGRAPMQRRVMPAAHRRCTAHLPIQRVGTVGDLLDSIDKIIKPPVSWKILGWLAALSDNGSDPSRPLFIDEYRTLLNNFELAKGLDRTQRVDAAYTHENRVPAKAGHPYLTMTWAALRDEIDLEKRAAEELQKKAYIEPERLQEMQNQATRGLGGAVASMYM